MRLIVILAVLVVSAVYTGYFNMGLQVWGLPFSLVAMAIATAAIAYALAFARA